MIFTFIQMFRPSFHKTMLLLNTFLTHICLLSMVTCCQLYSQHGGGLKWPNCVASQSDLYLWCGCQCPWGQSLGQYRRGSLSFDGEKAGQSALLCITTTFNTTLLFELSFSTSQLDCWRRGPPIWINRCSKYPHSWLITTDIQLVTSGCLGYSCRRQRLALCSVESDVN